MLLLFFFFHRGHSEREREDVSLNLSQIHSLHSLTWTCAQPIFFQSKETATTRLHVTISDLLLASTYIYITKICLVYDCALPRLIHSHLAVSRLFMGGLCFTSHSWCGNNKKSLGLHCCRKEGTGVAAVDFYIHISKTAHSVLQISLIWVLSCDRLITHCCCKKILHCERRAAVEPWVFCFLILQPWWLCVV